MAGESASGSSGFTASGGSGILGTPNVLQQQAPRVMGTNAYPWGALVFDGKDATMFLQRYSLMCADMNITEREKVDRLPHFCTIPVAQIVKCLDGFSNGDWEKLATNIKEEY